MASEAPINGNYAPHQGYGSIEQGQGGYSSTATSHAGYSNSTQSAAAANSTASEIPKDEVGWYFVEQYYTTLSRSPEKLYLFYNKRSQYVSGNETEKVAVSVGQRAINDRIKELDFQDCKVRVTNVDSQASDEHIVIQVIGEISNKSAPHKKFTQTFVLAGQTNGYFVLNDIFRYIVEEEDEVEAEVDEIEPEPVAAPAPDASEEEPAATPAQDTESKTLTDSADPAAIEHDAAMVDQKLDDKAPDAEDTAPPPAAVNGHVDLDDAAIAHAEEAPAAAVPATQESPAPAATEPAEADESVETEKPTDPEPTPAMSPVKEAPAKPASPAAAAAPAAPSKPSAPKTWANLAAAAHRVATPAVAVPQPSSSTAPAQPKAAPVPVQAAPAASSPVAASAPAREPSPAPSQQDEWTSVGDKKQQSKGQSGAGAQEGPQNRAYIKNVHESIDTKELRSLLEKFGEVVYFDVARQKNCAFVDFKTAEGYKAAIEANPHQIGNDRIVVEERRLKPGSYPYVQRGGMRGGRGAPNQGPNRGSFQGGRGGFPQRGRGNNNASRGRGNAQAA